MLPDDIVIKESQEVDMDFHARYKAKGKRYRYLIYNSQFPSALLKTQDLSCVSQNWILKVCKGQHRIFWGPMIFPPSDQAAAVQKTSVRTITDVSLEREDKIVKFEIAGDGIFVQHGENNSRNFDGSRHWKDKSR